MIVTMQKSKILEKIEKAKELEEVRAVADFEQEKRDYENDLDKYKDKVREYIALLNTKGEAPAAGGYYKTKDFYFEGISKPKGPKLDHLEKYKKAIDFLDLCEEEVIKLDTVRDRDGVGQTILLALGIIE